jgi:hypothetical protein
LRDHDGQAGLIIKQLAGQACYASAFGDRGQPTGSFARVRIKTRLRLAPRSLAGPGYQTRRKAHVREGAPAPNGLTKMEVGADARRDRHIYGPGIPTLAMSAPGVCHRLPRRIGRAGLGPALRPEQPR